MSRVLVLPGTEWQVPLAMKICEMGHDVYLVSPEEDPPCKKYAFSFLKGDIFDLDKIEEYAKKNRIDAVVSDECDIAMRPIAEISERLGLSALSIENAALYTNKYLMREFCKRHSFYTPEYKECSTIDEATLFLEELGKPVVIKPLDSNASHGVLTIYNSNEMRSYFNEALSFSRVDHKVLVERYINGTEFTVDGIKTPNAHYTLAISEKKHFIHNPNIANELYFTHNNNRYDYDKLKRINDAFVMESGLMFGFTHAEYKYEDGEFYLIEIAARGGGNKVSSVISQYMSGQDKYEYLINCALGEVTNQDFSIQPEYKGRASVLKFFETPRSGGQVKEIEGLNLLKKLKTIKEFRFNFSIGDRIEVAKNDSARIGFYIACCESKEELDEIMGLVEKNVRIVLNIEGVR